MRTIRKLLVTDENLRPIAVQIDYDDWIEIERLLQLTDATPPATDINHFAGTVTLSEDPLAYQRRIRG